MMERSGERRGRQLTAALAMVFVIAAARTGGAESIVPEYITSADDSYGWEIIDTKSVGKTDPMTIINAHLVSQTWRGDLWEHQLTIFVPSDVRHSDSAFLTIGGGKNNEDGKPAGPATTEFIMGKAIASQTRLIVALVSQVPNQPILDGRTEDAAIAYTFDEYLKTGEADWPLLMPMAKSAVRAMDAVQEILREKTEHDVKSFFVGGGSKRGWTTYLTAAADDRVMGIAPVVIQVLDMDAQMRHQLDWWGEFSPQIQDYTDRNLSQAAAGGTETDRGVALRRLVDPITYLDRLTMPKVIVQGTNDPYWPVDAADIYFDRFEGEKYIHYCPNIGHSADIGGLTAIAGIFALLLDDVARPQYEWDFTVSDSEVTLQVRCDQDPVAVKLWSASSPDADFRNETWTSTPVDGWAAGQVEATLAVPAAGYKAFYIESSFANESLGQPYGLSTMIKVIGTQPAEPVIMAEDAAGGVGE